LDAKSLDLLEFPRVRELVAGFTSFTVSHALALEVTPLTDHGRISLLLQQCAEARRLLDEDSGFGIGPVTDIREPVSLTAIGKVLEPPTLLEIQQCLAACRQVRRSLARHAPDYPRLWDICGGVTETPDLEKEIGRCLSPNGDVLDSASSQLSSIRQRLRKTRETLVSRLESTVKSAKGRRIVQEPIVTEREGRYVIPVKVEYRKEMRGIVHDMSNTGATLFIEPWATLDLGNELRQLVSEEKYEVERILRDLSLKVAVRREDIDRNVVLIAELDLVLAKARYSLRSKAVEPQVPAEGPPVIKLIEARHPLLGEKAVPLSVEIGKDFSSLVITGPNMGGKTVALKTIGLLSAMALSGLPLPASDQSSVPLFDGIFADIGDEQSIEQTISTFSWHVGNIVRIINGSTSKSLVLLDELGTSTDPAEGSALARSILLHLQSRRTMTVATTHMDDLKAFAHSTPGFRNASLDLDPVTRMPTYHFTLGIPGGSNALTVAERLGLPAEIIRGARELLGSGTQELESLLTDLGVEKGKLFATRRELEKDRALLSRRGADLDERASQVKAQERRLIETGRDAILQETADLQREIRAAVAGLRKARSQESVEEAKRAVLAVQQRLKKEIWQPPPAIEEESPADSTIRSGDTVLLKEANVRGVVVSVSLTTGQAEVLAGNARLTLGLSSLEKVVTKAGAVKPASVQVTKQVSHNVASQLDLRGRRADEIEPAVDAYLNSASVSGLNEVRIIHGMATGTVRKIVREFLATHPLVRSFRPGDRGEGADGATVVKL